MSTAKLATSTPSRASRPTWSLGPGRTSIWSVRGTGTARRRHGSEASDRGCSRSKSGTWCGVRRRARWVRVTLPAATAQRRRAVSAAERRRSSCSDVSASRLPLMPIGCPSAIAPPLTLTSSSDTPRSRAEAMPTAGERFVQLEQREVAHRQIGLGERGAWIALAGWRFRLGLSVPGHHAVGHDRPAA